MTKKEATAKAKALLNKMKTKGWKINLWKNQDWYYSITKGDLEIIPDRTIGIFDIYTGPNVFDFNHEGKDPNDLIKVLDEYCDEMIKQAESMKKLIR